MAIETPLLVPAFSSKGFEVVNGVSEIGKILLTAAEFVTGVYLISAYDIQRGNIPPLGDMPMPELIILDSGGYEISEGHDLSAINRSPPSDRDWSLRELEAVLDKWPAEVPAVFVSYDHPDERVSFEEQVARARELFKGRSNQLHCFLIKPEKKEKEQRTLKTALNKAVGNPGELSSFDLIGVTEKELGGSCLERMVQISRLRQVMDAAGVKTPIHVFGSLDPVSVCLYFLAGAEVFDGLSWIRYAFVEDEDTREAKCVYVHNHAALKYGIHSRDIHLRLRLLSQNYYYMLGLQERMKDFLGSQDFSKLPNEEVLRNARDSLQRKLLHGD